MALMPMFCGRESILHDWNVYFEAVNVVAASEGGRVVEKSCGFALRTMLRYFVSRYARLCAVPDFESMWMWKGWWSDVRKMKVKIVVRGDDLLSELVFSKNRPILQQGS